MVVTDDVEGGRIATGHLLALGHERIAFIGDEPDNPFGFTASPARERGYREMLRAAGLPVRTEHVRYGPHDRIVAQRLTEQLLAQREPPDRGLRLLGRAGHRRARRGACRWACAYPTTSRSSASTTSRSRRMPGSRRCASRSSRAAASAPNCCSTRSRRRRDPNRVVRELPLELVERVDHRSAPRRRRN